VADPRSDQALMAAHVAGDPHAFDELVRRNSERLWAFAVRTLGDSHEASDAVQEALLSAFRAAARWRGEASVSTWLHRIVFNACLDRLRRRRAHPTDPLDEDTDVPVPRDPMADRLTVLAVDEALGRLPLAQRAAVVLVDMEGLSIAEAAHVLGVREGTVKSRAARGRYRLAVLLGHLRPGAGNDDGPTGVESTGGDVSHRAGGER
jgi:RNA polymerase sigma-70 factor (ECF subfamily)